MDKCDQKKLPASEPEQPDGIKSRPDPLNLNETFTNLTLNIMKVMTSKPRIIIMENGKVVDRTVQRDENGCIIEEK